MLAEINSKEALPCIVNFSATTQLSFTNSQRRHFIVYDNSFKINQVKLIRLFIIFNKCTQEQPPELKWEYTLVLSPLSNSFFLHMFLAQKYCDLTSLEL